MHTQSTGAKKENESILLAYRKEGRKIKHKKNKRRGNTDKKEQKSVV